MSAGSSFSLTSEMAKYSEIGWGAPVVPSGFIGVKVWVRVSKRSRSLMSSMNDSVRFTSISKSLQKLMQLVV